jgi:hypothetical protein
MLIQFGAHSDGGLVKDIEKVQMRATKLIISAKHYKYEDRLRHLNIFTLKYRLIRYDMIETYKILTGHYDSEVVPHLSRDKNTTTRGHCFKLARKRCHYDLRKCAFPNRIVNLWNSLPEEIVTANTVSTFK